MQPEQAPLEGQSTAAKGPRGSKKKNLLLLSILIAIAVAATAWLLWMAVSDRNEEETPAAAVAITPDGFMPSTITIKKGSDVAWVNQDSQPRGIQGDQEDLGLKTVAPLAQGESYSFVFDEAGTYTYYDPLTPTFKATVVVE